MSKRDKEVYLYSDRQKQFEFAYCSYVFDLKIDCSNHGEVSP